MYLLWAWNNSFKLSSESVTASGSVANKEVKKIIKRFSNRCSLRDLDTLLSPMQLWTAYQVLPNESVSVIFICLFTTYALESQHTSRFKAYKKLNAPIILNCVCSVLLEPGHSFSLGIFVLFAVGGGRNAFYLCFKLEAGQTASQQSDSVASEPIHSVS